MAEPKSKLVDLKRTKADKKSAEKDMMPMSPMDSDYHYGLRIHLGDEELEKLGHKTNPEVGTEHRLVGHARVVRSEDSDDEHGGKRRRVELHVHSMEPLEAVKDKTEGKKRSVRDEISDGIKKQEEKSEKKAGARTAGVKDKD